MPTLQAAQTPNSEILNPSERARNRIQRSDRRSVDVCVLVPSLGLCFGFRIRGSVFGCFRVDEKVEGLGLMAKVRFLYILLSGSSEFREVSRAFEVLVGACTRFP